MVITKFLRRLASFLIPHPSALRTQNSKLRTFDSVEAYSHWAATYPAQAHNALMRAEEAALLALLPPLAGATVLDLACGSGRYARIAAERGAARVIGTDNSPHMLAAAQIPTRALATMDALPLATGSVDVALCGLATGHLREIGQAFAEMARVLRRGGYALVSDVHPYLFLNGAQRTFSSGGKTYAVEHYVHLASDYFAAAHAAGLRLDTLDEPRLLEDDRRDSAPSMPVAVVYRFVKE
jgi:malonyl-CoA O-methyltransferase